MYMWTREKKQTKQTWNYEVQVTQAKRIMPDKIPGLGASFTGNSHKIAQDKNK